jgi:anti-sigma-K factor RskA
VAVSESHEAYLELCAGHALDALEPADRERLEAHLANGCPECEAALADHAEAMVAMAATSPSAMPRASVKKRLFAQVNQEAREREQIRLPQMPPSPRPDRRAPWGLVWGLAAFGLLFLALNFWNWQRGNTLLQERNAARAETERLTQELQETQRLVGVAKLAILLPTPESNQNQRGTGYFDPATGNTMLVFSHMDKPQDRDFELWALHGPKPTSLGLLQVDANGNAIVNLKGVTDPAQLNAFAVSLEATGGSKSAGPTGPVVLVGTIGG